MRWHALSLVGCLAVFVSGCAADVEATSAPGDASSLVASLSAAGPIDSEYESFDGRAFAFREKSESLQRFGYNGWRRSADFLSDALSYLEHVDKRGKLALTPSAGDDGLVWFAALLEDGQTVYAYAGQAVPDGPFVPAGVCLADAVGRAEALIGRTLWSRRPTTESGVTGYLTLDPNVSVPRRHLQAVKVVGVDTCMYGHASPATIHLVITTPRGDRALVPHRLDLFYEEDPVKAAWGEDVGRAIRDERIRRGMTAEQVTLSWGEPERVKKLSTERERWIYKTGEYVDFEDGVMTGGKASR